METKLKDLEVSRVEWTNYGPLLEKKSPKNEEYEDDGTWIWVSMASECRMVLAYAIGERNQTVAKDIVAKTAKRLASIPLFVTDGLKFYSRALLEQYGSGERIPQLANAEDLEEIGCLLVRN